MARNADQPEAILWCDATRAPLVRRLLVELPELAVLAVGGPRRGDVAELAESVGLTAYDDLRQMLIDHPAGYLLLATAEGFQTVDLATALDEAIDVLTLEPILSLSEAMIAERGERPVGRLMLVPGFRAAPAWLAAADPAQALGPVGSLAISSVGGRAQVSLLARLADALDLALSLLGLPDQLDAALSGPLTEPPGDPRGLTGHLTVNLHFADQAGATLQVSDRASVHRRSLLAVGRDATLILDDHRYQLFAHDHDEAADPLDQTEGPAPLIADPARLIAAQWRNLIAGRGQFRPYDRRAVIGCCQAALLSVRTGQSESTDKLLRLGA